MRTFKRFDLLEAVELWAADNGCLASEEAVSELFDEEVLPSVLEQYDEDDEPAINEAFNNWTDNLCTDGYLHDEQRSRYCYVGRLA